MLQLAIRLLQLIIGFIAIGIVILIHEWGHFLMARLLKVEVETFSIGMGPKVFTIHGRKTEYCISLIPFGGYCQMKGSIDLTKALKDEAKNFQTSESGSYFSTTPFVRFLIFLAGPAANLLLSCLLFTLIALIPVEMISNESRVLLAADYPIIFGETVRQDELRSGDFIISLDGQAVTCYEDVEDYLSEHNRRPVAAVVERNGEVHYITLTPQNGRWGITVFLEPVVGRSDAGSQFQSGDRIMSVDGHTIGNSLDFLSLADNGSEITVERNGEQVFFRYEGSTYFPFAFAERIEVKQEYTVGEGILQGFRKTAEVFSTTIDSLIKVVTGRSADARQEITGPTRAAQSIGNITTLGFRTSFASGMRALLYLSAIVSISICLANLLPIPSFDGGQMVLNIYQMISRRELSPRAYVYFQIAGMVVSLIIIIMMYSLDIRHYLTT